VGTKPVRVSTVLDPTFSTLAAARSTLNPYVL
jgi:hypothetical protein